MLDNPTALQQTLHAIYHSSAPFPRMESDAEAGAIRDARLGDGVAFVALLKAYAPTLRKHARENRSFYDFLGEDEALDLVVTAFWQAVTEAEAGYLAGLLKRYLDHEFTSAPTQAVSVSRDSMLAYQAVMDRANGDPTVALQLCRAEAAQPKPEGRSRADRRISPETFLAVYAATNSDSLVESAPDDGDFYGTQTVDSARSIWEDPETDDARDLDAQLVEAALAALDDEASVVPKVADPGPTEREIVELKFHFQDDALRSLEIPDTKHLGLSDDFIRGELTLRHLGFDAADSGESVISRQKVQRTVAAALVTMRAACDAVLAEGDE